MDTPKRTVFTRADLESMLGEPIMDWQWEAVTNILHQTSRMTVNISKEDLFTNRPSLVDVIRDEMAKHEIQQAHIESLRR